MFDPDEALWRWRQQMAGAGIKSTQLLEELEAHLREEVDSQMRAGMPGEIAFETACLRLGTVDVLKPEFDKLQRANLARILRRRPGVIAAVGFVCMACGGVWYWLTLRVAIAIACTVPGSAGLTPVGMWSGVVFGTGALLEIGSIMLLMFAGRKKPKPITPRL